MSDAATSVPVWTWRDAIRKAQVPPLTKHVCNMIANYVSDVGEGCYPSVKALQADTGLSNKSLTTHLANAVRAGLLEVQRDRGDDGKLGRHHYFPRFPKNVDLPRSKAPPSHGDEIAADVSQGGREPDEPRTSGPDVPPSPGLVATKAAGRAVRHSKTKPIAARSPDVPRTRGPDVPRSKTRCTSFQKPDVPRTSLLTIHEELSTELSSARERASEFSEPDLKEDGRRKGNAMDCAISEEARSEARKLAAGWDIAKLEEEWRDWNDAHDTEISNPDRAFIEFCRKRGRHKSKAGLKLSTPVPEAYKQHVLVAAPGEQIITKLGPEWGAWLDWLRLNDPELARCAQRSFAMAVTAARPYPGCKSPRVQVMPKDAASEMGVRL